MTPPPIIAPTASRTSGWRWLRFTVFLGALAGLVVLARFDPEQHRFFPRCAFHELTGWSCPGCGGQRALHHLLHGEVMLALRHNLLLVALLPLGLWVGWRWLVRTVFGRELPGLFAHHYWPWLLAGAVIGFGVLRNLSLGG
jgi:hypothetical protein